MRKSLILLLFFIGFVSGVKAESGLIDTASYFPLTKIPHEYQLRDKTKLWHIRYKGLTSIANRDVYAVQTLVSSSGIAEKLADQSFYSLNEQGDILLNGYSLTGWYIKWLEQPEVILKKHMELGKSYYITDTTMNGRRIAVSISLKKIKQLKLKNSINQCIIIEKTTQTEYGFNNSTFSFEYRYYAKDVGLIEHTGSCSGGRCCNMAPSTEAVYLEEKLD